MSEGKAGVGCVAALQVSMCLGLEASKYANIISVSDSDGVFEDFN